MSADPNTQPEFATIYGTSRGRIGQLNLIRHGVSLPSLQTPLLFPVVCTITGTTARGGGLWKYILQANEDHGLMRRSTPTVPLMTQVLHFLDFGVSSQAFQKWRTSGISELYNRTHTDLDFDAPLFLDSGGFKLLFNTQLDLTAYGLPMDDRQAERIVELQKDLGGDIIASLDYPLPPGLITEEAKERMRMSRENAISAALYTKEVHDFSPFIFIAAHGQDGKDIKAYVSNAFKEIKHNGLADTPFGIAIGSLVPLRGARKYSLIIDLIQGAVRGIPSKYRDKIPVHVFGVSGNLIPLLVYLGVDTFDSSTYAQQARSLKYYDPGTHQEHAVLEMQALNCDCRICKDLDFDELHTSLTSDIRYVPLPTGHYKSKYYADIALHNLEMDFRIVDKIRQAIQAGDMVECLAEHAESSAEIRKALGLLAQQDKDLQSRLSRSVVAIPEEPLFERQNMDSTRPVSLKYSPDSFSLEEEYQPPDDKSILLIIPCSGEKPYSESKSHQLISQRLNKYMESQSRLVHKVTLSGLYGPVPEEFENEEPVMHYDFRLTSANKSQIALCVERTVDYLARFAGHYEAIFGYATSLAYRMVLEQARKECGRLKLYPTDPRTRRLSEFYRQSNVRELLDAVITVTGSKDNGREKD